MGRFIAVILDLLLDGWAVYVTIRFIQLKRLIAGSSNPIFLLSRRDRRAHARKLLQRQDDEYVQKIIEKTYNHINEGN
jgi:hypothetical protein